MSFSINDDQYNIGYLCTEKQCILGNSNKSAMIFLDKKLNKTVITFNDLNVLTNKFANTLINLGFKENDIIFTLLPKTIEQFVSFLGILKIQAIVGTLFSSFGEEAILCRLQDSKAKCVITKKNLVKKIRRIKDSLPYLEKIIVIDIDDYESNEILSYKQLMENTSDKYITPETKKNHPSIIHYTSGSTGKPKGVLHFHKGLEHITKTTKDILNLSNKDIFWCTADQGWVTGTSYGILGPWSLGITQIHYTGGYDPDTWFKILQDMEVSIWYTAPTALRMLMNEKNSLYEKYDLSNLKYIFSIGEPLNPEIIKWSRRILKMDIYDTWFQTETGGIMISNKPNLEIKPGSMGKPVEGIQAYIVSNKGNEMGILERGNLCLKPGWPSMFQNYINNEDAYKAKFKNGYYFTGDTAYKDEEGYFWFTGRNDDIINTAGHLISPFEIESALLEIPEIAEAGAIGAPDDLLFEKVVIFISLAKNFTWNKKLEIKIRIYLANKVSTIATPQEIIIRDKIPKNKSGKIMRRLLKSYYLGTDPGDISTMEE